MTNLEPRIVPTANDCWSLSVGPFAIAITKRRSAAQLLWLFLRDRLTTLDIPALSASVICELAAMPRSIVTGPNRFRPLWSLWGRAQVDLWQRIVRTPDDQPEMEIDFGMAHPVQVYAAASGIVPDNLPFTIEE